MPARFTALLIGLIALCAARPTLAADEAPSPVTRTDLNGAWTLREQGAAESIPATVPGVVHLDLLKARRIPDPFFGRNEREVAWVYDRTWVYERRFDIPADLLERDRIVLRCEGLDTVATVELNGRHVADTANMFRTFEFDIRPLLRAGTNELRITFHPIYAALEQAREAGRQYGPGGSFDGFGMIRKAAYSEGWDFTGKYLPMGIWRPISLVAWDAGRIDHLVVTQTLEGDLAADRPASARVDVQVATDAGPGLTASATLTLDGRIIATASAPAAGQTSLRLDIDHPRLWWPNGMGERPLYELTVRITDGAGRVIDQTTRRLGLRRVELLPRSDDRPLRLRVNGREIFAKGANWIPSDVFPPAETPERIGALLALAARANFNAIRVWGGGIYPPQSFFDACDEHGLLVWLDFAFACKAYPSANPVFMEDVAREVRDVVHAVHHHPSITVWCGNNEVEAIVHNYAVMSQAQYDALFHDTIGRLVREIVPDASFVGGSPEAGDEHNWHVWHVGRDFEYYRQSHGWMTEFGFQSFPHPATVESFTAPEDRDSVRSDVMNAHQKNGLADGNRMIVEMMARYFRAPKDFESAIWLSQINQAYGMELGIDHWRSDWPHSSGSFVWQLNDCWPGITWSMVDYYGRPKAVMYRMDKAFAPLRVTAVADPASGRVTTRIVSERPGAQATQLRWTLLDTAGAVLGRGERSRDLPPGTIAIDGPAIDAAEALQRVGRQRLLAHLELLADGNVVSRKVVAFVRPKALRLENPELTASIEPAGDGFDITITAARPALYAWLTLDGDPDARLSDNFVDVLPARPVTIHLTPSRQMDTETVRRSLRIRSLHDTYLPPDLAARIILPDATGALHATADKAEIISTSARLEEGNPPNIGGWSDAADEIEWTLRIDRPGTYQVTIDVACPPGGEGGRFSLTADGGSMLYGTVPATRGWEHYTTIDLGRMELAAPGEVVLRLRATHKPHGHLMNVRRVTLVSVE